VAVGRGVGAGLVAVGAGEVTPGAAVVAVGAGDVAVGAGEVAVGAGCVAVGVGVASSPQAAPNTRTSIRGRKTRFLGPSNHRNIIKFTPWRVV
jgi:hypothetical protein